MHTAFFHNYHVISDSSTFSSEHAELNIFEKWGLGARTLFILSSAYPAAQCPPQANNFSNNSCLNISVSLPLQILHCIKVCVCTASHSIHCLDQV